MRKLLVLILVLGTVQTCWAATASFRVAPDDVKTGYLPGDIITIELTADFGVSSLSIDYIYGPPTATDLVLHEDFQEYSPIVPVNSDGILFQAIAATTDMGAGDIAAGEVLLQFEYQVPDVPPSTIEISTENFFAASADFSDTVFETNVLEINVISEPPICVVPLVVNNMLESPQMNPTTNAISTLTNAGFTLGTRTTACSATVPPGKIISTTPAAGTQPGCGIPVNYVVSTGPCVCATCKGDLLPNSVKEVSDMSVLKAKLVAAYSRTGLYKVEKGSQITGDLWHICGDIIADNAFQVSDMSSLKAQLVAGYNVGGLYKAPFVPNLCGKYYDPIAACTAINNAGLGCGAVTYANHPTVPVGYVISTTPACLTYRNCGTTVNVLVSIGP